MPRYSYRCPECMTVQEYTRTMQHRDAPVLCLVCAFGDIDSHCERIPDAPAFTVTGFNAKNGYSK